jgi:LuxR family transcriptional regulator of spore coat protein
LPQFPDPRRAAIDQWYALHATRDVDALCELADPDIVVLPVIAALPGLPGVAFHGRAGLRTLLEWSFDVYPNFRLKSNTYREISPVILAASEWVLDDRSNPRPENSTYTLFDFHGALIRRVSAFTTEAEAVAAVTAKPMLTPREREVFQLLAKGFTTPQIAQELFVSPATVRTHVQNGIRRLGASTRIQAVSLALKRREISA